MNSVTRDPASALFRGIRRRLILWYSGVLAAMLLLSGIFLYTGTQRMVETPIHTRLHATAHNLGAAWSQTGSPPCVDTTQASTRGPFFIACYAANGSLLSGNDLAKRTGAFTTTTLVAHALAHQQASDAVDDHAGFGTIDRYAIVVHNASNNKTLGVIQVGITTSGELRAENTFLSLLIIIGVLTLLVAGGAGLWLAGLALQPARIAFARQQAFIADASHELRTPLTLLRSSAELLLRSRARLAPEDTALVEDIVAESEHLTALANQLLTLARLDSGVERPESEVVDLGAIATDIVRRVQALAMDRQIQVTSISNQTVLALGDPLLVTETALILVDNAIKYNRPGGAVTLEAVYADNQACLVVSDTGPGITVDQLPHLGERFYRVDAARSREDGGAGLGLAIAHGYIAKMSGTLHIDSPSGSGTTATIGLPAIPAPPLAPE